MSPLTREPIAIVGMGCRFPGGAHDPDSYWDLLTQGRDAIIDIPADRWNLERFYDPDQPGKMYVRQGGFLQQPFGLFDADFFGISPREAATLDPQQRLLLEVAWEAFEDAGLGFEHLRGSNTGVYIGAFTVDNMEQQLSITNRDAISSHTPVSCTMTMLSNRISYTFNLQGPSMSMDTACSSSLVALHTACNALWNQECDLAISGGVNLMFRPEMVIAMCKGRFLSPDARCKAFDASANGYVRGEGAGIVVLKPLAAALADGDRIYALVRATGVNQDGRTNGITVPSNHAQQRLVRDVCARAGITPGQLDYVEAHGTGTQIGDTTEATSLGSVLGRSPDDPCWIGSVKTNIGHLEAAAGVAALIKTVLMLRHKAIPPHLHYHQPSSNFDLHALGLRIPQQVESWPDHTGPALAGINSFGYGGTNAHAVLQEAPPQDFPAAADADHARPWLVPLSAHSDTALTALAGDHARFLAENPGAALNAYAYTVSQRRSHHPHRLAFAAPDREHAIRTLDALSAGELPAGVVFGTAQPGPDRVPVFVYTGMGPQWWGMGTELMQQEPVFRAMIERCAAIFERYAGWSLLDLFAENTGQPMNEPKYAQPANLAIQVALTALWQSYGVEPRAVVGHSTGEIAAAAVAGTLSLEDALRVIYYRSSLMQTTVGQGAMLATGLGVDDLRPLLNGYSGGISIAAINSRTSTTLSGDPDALRQVAAQLDARGTFNRFLRLEVAYHSYQMDSMEEPFKAGLAGLHAGAPRLPIYSTVTGRSVAAGEQDIEHWWHNARGTVQLAAALDALITNGYDTFVEVGPHPVLAASIKESLRDHNVDGVVVSSLQRQQPEQISLLTTLGALYTHGYPVNWSLHNPPDTLVSLPAYPWQREYHWDESPLSWQDRVGADDGPLAQRRQPTALPTWESDLGGYRLAYLRDHVVDGAPLFPAAAFIETALEAASIDADAQPLTLESIRLERALPLDPPPTIQITLDAGQFAIYSRVGDAWTGHATGRVLHRALNARRTQIDLDEFRARCPVELSRVDVYRQLAGRGLAYGPAFQGIQRIWRGAGETLAEIAITPDSATRIHPSLLDACFQSLIAALDAPDFDGLAIPVRIEQVRLIQDPGSAVICFGHLTQVTPQHITGDLWLCDDAGRVLVEIVGLQLKRLAQSGGADTIEPRLYTLAWEPRDLISDTVREPGHWLIVANGGSAADALAERLTAHGDRITWVTPGDSFAQVAPDHYTIQPESRADMEQVIGALFPGTITGLLVLWDSAPTDPRALTGIQGGITVLHMVQALSAPERAATLAQVAFVTVGGQAARESDPVHTPGQAVLWGLGRVIANEHASLRPRRIDLDPDALPESLDRLVRELLAGDDEPEVALRAGVRLVHRLNAVEPEPDPPPIEAGPDTAFELVLGQPALLDSLDYRATTRRPPGAGEIEVRVQASALNFKDLMKVMGLLPDSYLESTFYSSALGLECAGEVVAVGDGVESLRPGDGVIAFNPAGAFQSFITLPAAYVIPKPGPLAFTDSVVFVNFITAYYGLHHVARLGPGERVLIHSAAGGVGLAAIQIARWLGAEVYATAGTEEKRALLREMGVQGVSDSRSLAFADDVWRWTDGAGVDVVLNTLTGEALAKSFALLAPYGRFVELGKRDILDDTPLAMAAFDRSLTFAALDLDLMMVNRPDLFTRLADEVRQHFEDGDFQPLPVTVFPAAHIGDAFRLMAQAKHTGKIVIDMHDQRVPVRPLPDRPAAIHPAATYLITGGLSGLGLETAKWMVGQGARRLVLASRSGAASSDAQSTVQMFADQGVEVIIERVDVSDPDQVARLIAHAGADLRGIIHSAMVLDDEDMLHLDAERFERVLAPKVLGAWYLHQATRDLPLDFFVMYSSVSAFIGNPRQANYVAANAFLDALAHTRRAQGLAGMCINWGSIGKVGVVARNPKVEQYLSQLGLRGIDPDDAMDALGHLLDRNPVQVAVLAMDWQKWATNSMGITASPLYAPLVADYLKQSGSGDRLALLRQLHEAGPDDAGAIMQDFLREQLARVTRMPADRLDVSLRLDQLGIDSLMGIELNNLIKRGTGVEFSVMTLTYGLTIAQLADHLLGMIEPE